MLVQQAGARLIAQFDGTPIRDIIEQVIAGLRRALADDVWALYHKHADDVLLTKRVLFVTVTLRVRHAQKLIELIAGPEPMEGA